MKLGFWIAETRCVLNGFPRRNNYGRKFRVSLLASEPRDAFNSLGVPGGRVPGEKATNPLNPLFLPKPTVFWSFSRQTLWQKSAPRRFVYVCAYDTFGYGACKEFFSRLAEARFV